MEPQEGYKSVSKEEVPKEITYYDELLETPLLYYHGIIVVCIYCYVQKFEIILFGNLFTTFAIARILPDYSFLGGECCST